MKRTVLVVPSMTDRFVLRLLDSLRGTPLSVEAFLIDTGLRFTEKSSGTWPVEARHLPVMLCHEEREKRFNFARAVNHGLRYALRHGLDVVVMNDDAWFFDKPLDPIKLLADFAKYTKAGIVAPLIAGPCAVAAHQVTGPLRSVDKEVLDSLAGRVCTWAPFICAYMPLRTIEMVGLLDESFLAGYEDNDYCLRAYLAGLSIHLDKRVVVGHEKAWSPSFISAWGASDYERDARTSRQCFEGKWSQVPFLKELVTRTE